MDWLNIHTSTLDSAEFLRCDPVRRATWLCLIRYCIGQENGGLIRMCRGWSDTTWQQLCRVRLREARAESPLWTWEADDLRVSFYPTEKEAEVQAKREVARANGRAGGRPKRTNVGTNVGYALEPTSVESVKAEGNGKEGNGIGMEGPPPSPSAPVQIEPASATAALRRRIDGVSDNRVRAAIAADNPMALLGAYGVNLSRDEGEWIREADGLQVGELAAILAWRRHERDPIREPSGLRQSREAWAALTREQRKAWADDVAALVRSVTG